MFLENIDALEQYRISKFSISGRFLSLSTYKLNRKKANLRTDLHIEILDVPT
jgi:hypothetical protein